MTKEQTQQEALNRIESNPSEYNFATVIEGFMEMGIEEEDILPKENVFTFNAWLAKGRCVKKGQHGVKITTFIPVKNAEPDKDGRVKTYPKTSTVFHISQTEEVKNANQ